MKIKQYGGTAIFTVNDISHKVIARGKDNSNLGRWCFTTLRGKNNQLLTIITAYCPNPPQAGVMGVYAQHAKYFNLINRDSCPRQAFLDDLKQEIIRLQQEGHNIILMLDGNEDMRRGPLKILLTSLLLKEVILQRHGNRAPSTYRRNSKDVPIDGIWASLNIDITAGGYFAFDEVISATDHRTLWIDITYNTAFSCEEYPPICRPSARKLNNQNPNIRDNFNRKRRQLAAKSNLCNRIVMLEHSIAKKMSIEQIQEYEAIDRLRTHHARIAEAQCRKLRCGNVPYSPELQSA